ncbi:MAG: hypothetical protein ABID83_05730 [Candidatus Omnitrophota bacterium]
MKRITVAILSIIFVFSMAVLPSSAQGIQRIIYMEEYEPIYSVDIDNTIWDVRMDNGDITGVSEDGMMWFFLGDVKGIKGITEAADEIKSEMEKAFTDIKVVQTIEDFTINGLPAYSYEATAKANGKDVVCFVVLFQLETDDAGVLLFIMDPLAEELHFQKIMKMTMSVARR